MTVYFQVKDDYMFDGAYQDLYEHGVKSVTTHKDFYRLVSNAGNDGTWAEKCVPKTYFELRGVYEESES